MNAKKAKKLRKLAANGEHPDRLLLGHRSNRWDGSPFIQAINAPYSVRGIYRELKKVEKLGI